VTAPHDDEPGPVEAVRIVHWSSDGSYRGRPGLPWAGILLVLFGGLLLIDQVVPAARLAGSAFVVALGVALTVAGWTRGPRPALYVGLVLASISLPGLLQELGGLDRGAGWGSLFLGIGLLVVALARWIGRGGSGWQATLGLLFALLGGAQIAERAVPAFPALDRVVWPAAIVLLGAWIIVRGLARKRR
jgi:hypothetical protein